MLHVLFEFCVLLVTLILQLILALKTKQTKKPNQRNKKMGGKGNTVGLALVQLSFQLPPLLCHFQHNGLVANEKRQ